MPRVNTAKAAKDYPSHGIKKGETYYHWSFRYGGKRMSKTRPRPSQLTQSKMSAALAAGEALEDVLAGTVTCPEDVVSAFDDAIGEIEGVRDEYQESLDNMISQDGMVAEQIQEKIDGLEEWIQTLEDAKSEVENVANIEEFWDEQNHHGTKPEDVKWEDLIPDEQEAYSQALVEAAGDVSCPVG